MSTRRSRALRGAHAGRWLAALAIGGAATVLGLFAVSGSPSAAAEVAAAGSHCAARFPPVLRDGFPEPPMRFSSGGRLETTLRIGRTPVTINGRRYVTETYEGTFPGPTLVICPGDNVTVHLINDMAQPTNLHVHGLHVSPTTNHDNVYLDIRPHHAFTYHYHLPLDHDPGAFWYHPHLHHFVAPQIFAGLSGAIVVEGGLDNLLANVPQRLMVIQSTELCTPARRSIAFSGSGTEPCSYPRQAIPDAATNERYTPLFVNGVINPTVKIRPGQIQRWRIFNANNNRIVVLNLRGQDLQVMAEDGNTLRWMRPTRNLMIGPGSRREVLVRGGSPGRYEMKALPFAQFPGGDRVDTRSRNGGPTPNQTVLTVVSSGRRAQDRFPRGPLNSPIDLRKKHVDRRRVIVFSEMPTAMNMTIFELNGRAFDPNYVAVTMKLGSVEEWTLVNTNTEWHTFHIHLNPFQVISINGLRLSYVDYEDNVAMPPHSKIVIRMNPIDFTGKFVFHCHVTNHEDRGMMAAVQVVRTATRAQLEASVVRSGGFSIRSNAYEARTIAAVPVSFICHLLGLPAAQEPGAGRQAV